MTGTRRRHGPCFGLSDKRRFGEFEDHLTPTREHLSLRELVVFVMAHHLAGGAEHLCDMCGRSPLSCAHHVVCARPRLAVARGKKQGSSTSELMVMQRCLLRLQRCVLRQHCPMMPRDHKSIHNK